MDLVLLFLQKNLSTLQSAAANFTWRNIASTSAVKAICFALNLKIIPMSACNRSGPAIKLSFRETPANFETALHTCVTLSGLFKFSTGRCGTYHCRSVFVFSSPFSSRILMNPFLTSTSIVCWELFFNEGLFPIGARGTSSDSMLKCNCLASAALNFSRVARLQTSLRRTSWFPPAFQEPSHPPWTSRIHYSYKHTIP